MILLYFSPVPWSSFSQRPHHFVNWYQSRFGGKVLWVDPYPSRLPRLSDIRRLFQRQPIQQTDRADWLTVIKPKLLPVEPLPLLAWINNFIWSLQQKTLKKFTKSAGNSEGLMIAIGKPSAIALAAIRQLKPHFCLLDAMDDFSEFHTGIANRRLREISQVVVEKVDCVWASSTNLKTQYSKIHRVVLSVPNGLDDSLVNAPTQQYIHAPQERSIAGYIGTIGDWFDWDWVSDFAKIAPNMMIELIGPAHSKIPRHLPANISFKSALPHSDAISHMQKFRIGLIPFKKNLLTDSVDPIKYYEYIAAHLPIISSDFGEMSVHCAQPGVFICSDKASMKLAVDRALNYRASHADTQRFIKNNNWRERFDSAYEKKPFTK